LLRSATPKLAHMKKASLGKGLQSLVPIKSVKIKPSEKKESVFYIDVKKIRPNPNQPRKNIDQKGIKELADSVRRYGILQPLLVSKVEKRIKSGIGVSYQLIAGHRRLLAAKKAGLATVPVIIREDIPEVDDQKNLEIALIENVQRKDLNPIERAQAFFRLKNEFGLNYDEISKKVGKNKAVVINTVRLLNLEKDIQEAVKRGKITGTQARALLMFDDKPKRRQIFKKILTTYVPSNVIEKMAAELRHGKRKDKGEPKFKQLEEKISKAINAKVVVSMLENGRGRLAINFKGEEHLQKIAKKLTG